MLSGLPLYKRNLIVLWVGCLFTGIGLSLINPFLPLYIDTLGYFDSRELAFWSGIIIAAPFLLQALVSPLWGKLADRSGRKLMLLRASLGMSVLMMATGFASNVWLLLLCRAAFGLFSGFISNAVALIAVQVPKEESGKVLGTLATSNTGGMLVGPIFGGLFVTFLGYRYVFVTGSILMIVFILTLALIKEDFTPVAKGAQIPMQEVFAMVERPQIIFGLYLTTLMIMLANTTINPMLPLYVREMLPVGGNVELWSGIVAAAPGMTTIIAAPLLGALGDRVGTHKVLISGLVFQAMLFLPMAFVTAVWQIAALRLLLGVADAALMPSAQALLTRNSPKEATSRIFAYNQSAQSTGMVTGPLVGAAIGGMLAIRYVFFATMAFGLANASIVAYVNRKRPGDKG
ncbi:MAG: MFS transporter [Coriobacteriia bacterium]|nr:MFS transporter [Coriobacteriia bacterium]